MTSIFSLNDSCIIENNNRILAAFNVQPRSPLKQTFDIVKNKKESCSKKENIESNASDDIKKFLWEVYKNQYKKTKTEIYQLADLGVGGKGQRASTYCEKQNLIEIIRPKLGKGSAQYPILTSKGCEVIGVSEKKFYGKGASHEHILYQFQVADRFSGHVEYFKGGKHVDVAVLSKNGFVIALEVELSSAHAIENIEKDIEMAEAEKVVIAAKDSKVLKEIEQSISRFREKYEGKIHLMLISELLKIEPDELFDNLVMKGEKIGKPTEV